MTQGRNLIVDGRAEHGLDDDGQREPHHLVVHVERLLLLCSFCPIPHEPLDHHRDGIRQPSQSFAVEGRLEHAPLPQPEVAVDEGESIP